MTPTAAPRTGLSIPRGCLLNPALLSVIVFAAFASGLRVDGFESESISVTAGSSGSRAWVAGPAGPRGTIPFSLGLFASTSTSEFRTFEYVAFLRLVDPSGAAQLLVGEDGTPVEEFPVHLGTLGLFYHPQLDPEFSYGTSLRGGDIHPVGPLSPCTPYRLIARLHERQLDLDPDPDWVDTGIGDTASEAFLVEAFENPQPGATAPRILARVDTATFERAWSLAVEPSPTGFLLRIKGHLARYDSLHLPPASRTLGITYHLVLEQADDRTPVLTRLASSRFQVTAKTYDLDPANRPVPSVVGFDHLLEVFAVERVLSATGRYRFRIEIFVDDPVSGESVARTCDPFVTDAMALRRLNGTVVFGDLPTLLTRVDGFHAGGSPSADRISGFLSGSGFAVQGEKCPYQLASHRVLLEDDGTLVFWDDTASVSIDCGLDARGAVRHVEYRRKSMVLHKAGGTMSLDAYLPAGVGYAKSKETRILESVVPFDNIKLYPPDLRPGNDSGDISHLPDNGVAYLSAETLPVWIQVSAIDWNVEDGHFTFTSTAAAPVEYLRAVELDQLWTIEPSLENPSAATKRSNDEVFRFASGLGSESIRIRARAGGGYSESLVLLLANAPYTANLHFPYGATIQFSGGRFEVADGLVLTDTTKSYLDAGSTPQASVHLSMDPNCGGCGRGVTEFENFDLMPKADFRQALPPLRIGFTPDAGLRVETWTLDGPVIAGLRSVRWGARDQGRFAFQSRTGPDGTFLSSGSILRGLGTTASQEDKPFVLLHSGFGKPGQSAYVERPDTALYLSGHADYPGLNLRAGALGLSHADSLVGEEHFEYDLAAESKYYLRYSGVTGIHVAALPSSATVLPLFGYDVRISSYGLAFQDNENSGRGLDSIVSGRLFLKYPSQFEQPFETLRFDCFGFPVSAAIPDTTRWAKLEFWQKADIRPLSLSFSKPAGCPPQAGPSPPKLIMDCEVAVSLMPKPSTGTLGWHPSGNLVTRADGVQTPGGNGNLVDSRVRLDARLAMAGPGDESYSVTPTTDAYFNNFDRYQGPVRNTDGFLAFGASVDVAVFDEVLAHVHTRALRTDQIGGTPPIHMMRGWNLDGSPGPGFRANRAFDPDNSGFPGADRAPKGLAAYRESIDRDFRPRAIARVLEVIALEYPVRWNHVIRSFRSTASAKVDLVALDVPSRLDFLSSERVEIRFGVGYDIVPGVTLGNLVFDTSAPGTGTATVFANAGLADFGRKVDTGNRGMNLILDSSPSPLFGPAIRNALSTESFRSQLRSRLQEAFLGVTAPSASHAARDALANAIASAMGPDRLWDTSNAGLKRHLSDVLETARVAVASSRELFSTAGTAPRVRALLRQLLDVQGTPGIRDKLRSGLLDDAIDRIVRNLLPTLDRIDKVLGPMERRLETARMSGLDAVGTEIRHVLSSSGSAFAVRAVDDLISKMRVTQLRGGNWLAEHADAAVEEELERVVESAFYSLESVASVQSVLRHHFQDVSAFVRESIDGAFGAINDGVRQLILESHATVAEALQPLRGLDSLSAGRLDGYVSIRGRKFVERIRLDGYFDLDLAAKLQFHGYLDITEWDSSGLKADCANRDGLKTLEIRLGASDVKVGWISPDLRTDLEMKMLVGDSEDQPGELELVGGGGSIRLRGGIRFEGLTIEDFGANVSVGDTGTYVATLLQLEFEKRTLKGGAFFGKTCSIEPLVLVDPKNAKDLAPRGVFKGFYLYGEAWLPINDLFFLPATCLFNIRGGAGYGAFYNSDQDMIGGKWLQGIDGQIACLIGVRGTIELLGMKRNDELFMKGTGTVEATIGIAPAEITIRESLTLSISISPRGVKFDYDF